jgi:hypothetical protein
MQKPIELKGIWKFLQDCGVLDNGTAEDIERARKSYWKEYRRIHKTKLRNKKPEMTVSIPSIEIYEELKKAAKAHHRPLSTFILECTEAYLKQSFVNPNEQDWKHIRQFLYKCEIAIRRLAEEDNEAEDFHRNYELLIEKLMFLENELEDLIHRPELIENAIKSTIQKKPWCKQQLKHLIESL